MTRVIIPRAAGAKVVESTDFEKYFCEILPTYATCGWTVTDPCAGLAACVAAGKARFLGLYLENTVTCQVTCLTACSINHIFAQVTRDACCRPASWAFTTNTTGVLPSLSFRIGTATTNATQVTAVTTDIISRSIEVGLVDTCSNVYPHSTCICDYTSPTVPVSSSDCPVNAQDFFDDFTTDCWTDTGTGIIVGCGTLGGRFDRDGTNEASHRDILCGAVNNTKWSARFKLIITCWATTGNDNVGFIGYSSTTGASNDDSARDALGMSIGKDLCTRRIRNVVTNGTAWPSGGGCDFGPNCTGTFYVQFIRKSATSFKVELFNMCDFTCTAGSSTDNCVSACTQGLQYWLLQDRSSSASCCPLVFDIDCLRVWCNKDIEVDCFADPNRCVTPCATVDNRTCTFWLSTSEVNPTLRVDMGSNKDLSAIALHLNCGTTESVIKIRASTDTCFTDSETVRTINVSDLTCCAYNFIRLDRLPEDRRHIQIFGDDTGAGKIGINEIKYLAPIDFDRKHGHLKISSTDKNLNLDGTPEV